MTIHINSDQDWSDLEQKAQDAERREAESYLPVLPVPEPTVAQQLAFTTVRCAELQARMTRKDSAIASAIMYLNLGEPTRALEHLNRGLLDL